MAKKLNNIIGHLGNTIQKQDSNISHPSSITSQDTIGGIAQGLNIYANNHVGLEQFQRYLSIYLSLI